MTTLSNVFRTKTVLILGMMAVVLGTVLLRPSAAQEFPDVCQEEGNIMPNCDFSNGLDGWTPYLLAGSADIRVLQGGGECHAPLCPAAYIVSEDHFVGGIYQQVNVTPGASYYANIVWLVFDSLVNDGSVNAATGGVDRRIGIDPTGGTDPGSPNIVWSVENRRNDCKICNVEHVTVTAQAETITVFLKIDDQWRLVAQEKGFAIPPSKDQFWLDDIGMKQVGEAPAAVPQSIQESPVETPTPIPPTNTPAPPTNTPAPTEEPESISPSEPETESTEEPAADPTDKPTDEPTEEPTEAPIEAPTAAAPTVAPPPTLTPTHTPPPTNTPRPRPSPTPRPTDEPLASAQPEDDDTSLPLMLSALGTMGCVGGLGLSFAGVVMAGLVWLYRLGWGTKDDDEYEYTDYDETI